MYCMFQLIAAAALASVPGPADRLIETVDGRAWMSPDAVQQLSQKSHREGHCGGFIDVTSHPQARRPVIDVLMLADRKPSQMKVVRPLLPALSAERLVDTVRSLSDMHDRYYNGAGGEAGSKWISDKFKEYAHGKKGVSVEYFNHDFRQPSVIARIAGTGPHAHEKVILGAHEDSVNWEHDAFRGRGRAPGADDNASGIAVLLEVFHALVNSDYQPQRTIEFMAYAGEELGLLGSMDIAEAYHQAHEKVVGVLQMDMTLFPAHTHKITLVTDNVSRSLTNFTEKLIDTYVGIPWQETRCGYACSDHASWEREGFSTVFPFETAFDDSNPNIHSDRDTLEHGLSGDFGLQFAKLNTAFAIEMAAP